MKYYGVLKQLHIGKREILLSSNNILFYRHMIKKYIVLSKKRFFKLEHLFNKSKNSIVQNSIVNQQTYFQNFKTELHSTTKQYLRYLKKTPNEIARKRDITQLVNTLKTVTEKNKNITEHIHTFASVEKNTLQKEKIFATKSFQTFQLIHANKIENTSVKSENIVTKEVTIEKEKHTKEMIKENVKQEVQMQKKQEFKDISENIYATVIQKWQKDLERRGVFHA